MVPFLSTILRSREAMRMAIHLRIGGLMDLGFQLKRWEPERGSETAG